MLEGESASCVQDRIRDLPKLCFATARFHATIGTYPLGGRGGAEQASSASCVQIWYGIMRISLAPVLGAALFIFCSGWIAMTASAADLTTSGAASAVPPPPPDTATYAGDSNAAKARNLVKAAINLTDSDRAVNMLWEATNLDPSYEDAYLYLGLYYNSRAQWDRVVQVYQKLVKSRPKETSAWLNIGEAYMSYSPPRFDSALPYYRKALELDPGSSFAALRLGEIYAQENNRDEAFRYLRQASGDRVKNPEIADQADRLMRQLGS
jgi:tetratricopeptide (TPR) repeat protein